MQSISLNGCSDDKQLSHYPIELFSGRLLQGNVPESNLIPTAGPTELYITLNAFPATATGQRDLAALANPGQVNLAILLTATFTTVHGLPDFQPRTNVMASHVDYLRYTLANGYL